MQETCPRCHHPMGRPAVALSRTDNKTYVCPACGTGEGMEVARGELTPQDKWPGGLRLSVG